MRKLKKMHPVLSVVGSEGARKRRTTRKRAKMIRQNLVREVIVGGEMG